MRESLNERERLLRFAPHLVAPLELYIPVYARARRKRWQIGLGLTLYDWLSADRSLPGHTLLGRAALLEKLPGLNPAGLVGGASYFDAQARYPERLVVENVLDAVANGAVVKTYTRVTRIVVEAGRATGVEWRTAGGESGAARAPARRQRRGPVGRRGARRSSPHAADRRHQRQPPHRAAFSGRAERGRLHRSR